MPACHDTVFVIRRGYKLRAITRGRCDVARVLLIDDDELVLETMQLALTGTGHDVRVARDGGEALGVAAEFRPDLVVTDIVMPQREGLETIRELRRARPEVRIVAVSGGGSTRYSDYLDLARKFGADRVLRKPFTPGALRKIVEELLEDGV